MLLEEINSPKDLKRLKISELETYADEVKNYIIKVISENGGHLASNLGAVDMTIAMHYVFDCPTDKILFDVGHQSYTHKIITGRREEFKSIRTSGGLSGFEKLGESEYDAFTMGHSSTSLSAALGFARARDLKQEDHNIISVIGDGAFTGGMIYEAMNDIGSSKTKLIIVLNDNEMSISKNVGAISSYLDKLRLSKRYKKLEKTLKSGIDGLPIIGPPLTRLVSRAKTGIRTLVTPNKMFEHLGLKYYGAFDGHSIKGMIELFEKVKSAKEPVIIHLVTKKGKGLIEAELNPEKYHGLDCSKSVAATKFSDTVSKTILEMGAIDDRVVTVGAAMLSSTGLAEFADKYPDRCFDVGIAEQHAVTMAAGMAAGGYKPYFTVYSTFLQRGFDQLLHDVCVPRLPVRFLIDRAGVIGSDGVTHQGVFDLGYLTMLPGMTVLAPADGHELEMMMKWSLGFDKPLAIRYPKSYSTDYQSKNSDPLQWITCSRADTGVFILAVGGRMLDIACRVKDVTVVNCRCVKPLDEGVLNNIPSGSLVITMEDGILRGGFGQSVAAYLDGKDIETITLGYKDELIEELDIGKVLSDNGMTKEILTDIVQTFIKKP